MPGHTRGERSRCLCRRSMTASRKFLRRRCGRYSPPSARSCWPRTGSGRRPPGSSRAAVRRPPPGRRIRPPPRLRHPPPRRPVPPVQPGRPGRPRGTRGGGHWTRRGTSGCWTGAKKKTTRTCPGLGRPFLNRLPPRCRPPSTRPPKLSQPSLSAAEPAPAEAEPAQPATAASEALPVPNYDQLSVASLRARLRVLDAGQVQALLDYENVHESRPAVITMFERRLSKLGEGN